MNKKDKDKNVGIDYEAIFLKRLEALNEKQREAVDATEGPVIVVAGPGSGKTELLSLRVANIIYEGLARPENILCLTFTETATRNMIERLTKVIGSLAYKVPIRTFHSFCTEIINKYPEHFFDAHRFEPIAELKQNEILSSIFKDIKYGNPLFGFSEDRGHVYFRDTKVRIQNFKEAGLSPNEVRELLNKNKEELKTLSSYLELVPESLRSKDSKENFLRLAEKFLESGTELGKFYGKYILNEAENGNLSKAKLKLFEKNEEEKFNFKDERNLEKLFALADIYEKYQKELEKYGFFDFNDMIIYVKDRLISNSTLRAELEETYQYILVDEFQDTNLAQLKLIESITKNPVLEGRANVFVVGDDDQSIYKFQGAELSNIFNFEKMYKDVKFIVLTENYRSTQKVLDFARTLIEKAEVRLTKTNASLVKELVAKNENLMGGEICLGSFKERASEYLFVAKEIKRLTDSGVDPKEIAIITRRHAELQEILPYLDSENVSYNYERKESVFDEVHIEPLIKISKFLESVASFKDEEADELLPEILSYQFLNIDRIDVWDISRLAREEKKSWLEVMTSFKIDDTEKENIRELAKFFIELGLLAKTTQLEIILDILIGSKDVGLSQDENEDETFNHSLPNLKSRFISNYKKFYFGESVMEKNLAAYIHFLSSLRVFIYALREYKKGEKLFVSDLSSFIKLHKDYNVPLLNKSSFVGDASAIHLMTAHKSKGLEFEYVFLVSLEEGVWKSKGINNKISLPMNMSFDRAPDDEDDFLRLFFVGVTRAKHTIYLTHSDMIFSFLADQKESDNLKIIEDKIENKDLVAGLNIYHIPPFAKNEKALLTKILENYKLSPTHLNNFLNITKGGPKVFLEQNLLLFPQAKTSSAMYGSAIHKAIEDMYVITKNTDKLPSLPELENIFEREIKKGRLLEKDEEDLISKGKEHIQNFYKLKSAEILKEAKYCKTELDFKWDGIVFCDALFTGKIDRIKDLDNVIEIVDLKSGKAFNSFEIGKAKKEDYDNIKKHNYKQQLMFYKMLLENSQGYSSKDIKFGKISFVDDDKVYELILDFEKDISKEEFEDFKKLIVSIYKIIKDIDALQNIDISKYEKNIDGILAFEKDIIENKI